MNNGSKTLTLKRGREILVTTTYEATDETANLHYQNGEWIAGAPSLGNDKRSPAPFEITSATRLANHNLQIEWLAAAGASDPLESSVNLSGEWQAKLEIAVLLSLPTVQGSLCTIHRSDA